MGDNGTDAKLNNASNWIHQMMVFIKNHPKGYDENGMLSLIKSWAIVGRNWGNTGDPESSGDKYIASMKRYLLADREITATTPLVDGHPDYKDDMKPSARLYRDLSDLMPQVFGMGAERVMAFTDAEAALWGMLKAFRIQLAKESPERARKFRHSLSALRHQLH